MPTPPGKICTTGDLKRELRSSGIRAADRIDQSQTEGENGRIDTTAHMPILASGYKGIETPMQRGPLVTLR